MNPQLLYYLISTSILLISSYVIFRILIRRDYQQRGRLSWLSSFLELVLCLGFAAIPHIYNPPCWPYVWSCQPHAPLPIAILGYFIIGAGVILGFGSMLWLGVKRSFGQKATGLFQTGPYRFSRNPQVIGGFLIASGIALLWPSWYALGWVILWIVTFHLMVLTEEEHLQKIFGVKYEHYCKEVPRYLVN
jgi:protein-S-isoprenylcysteine O-methyltransferase Ste14